MDRLYVGALIGTFCSKEDLRWYFCSYTGSEVHLISGTKIEFYGHKDGYLVTTVIKSGETRTYHLTPKDCGL